MPICQYDKMKKWHNNKMWLWQNDTMPWKGDISIKKLVYERMAIHMIQWDMLEWQNESVIYQQKRTEDW